MHFVLQNQEHQQQNQPSRLGHGQRRPLGLGAPSGELGHHGRRQLQEGRREDPGSDPRDEGRVNTRVKNL